MKKLLLSLFAATALFGSASAATREFTVAASNVDGLPPVVHIDATIIKKDIEMNPDGSQETGATRMGQLFAQNLWDIVALSEDFNYHDYIMQGASQYYNASTHRGKIEQKNLSGSVAGYLTKSVYMKTDGLCLLSRKKTQVLEEKIVRWNDHYGYDDHEADGLIDKGYRFYQICLEGELVIDVYIMHMDAGSDAGDIGARTKQLKQLTAAIKASQNGNPIIILGDTNCRYTRDTLKEDLINSINDDPRFEIKDPWVQYYWDDNFEHDRLQLGQESIMVSDPLYKQQKGEVVDKIFYINNRDSECKLTCTGYLHDDSFTYADGSQIADHFPVVASMVIEGPDVPEPPAFEYPTAPEKTAVVSGTTYFLRNVGSGEFLRAGGAWTTQAVMGDYPSKVIPTRKSGDKFTLKTTHDNKWLRWDVKEYKYYMDQDENEWTLTQVKDNIYTLTDADGHAVSHANGVMAYVETANSADPNQQWEFLTKGDLINEIYYASSAEPKDATFLMKCPDFGFADQESWTNSNGTAIVGTPVTAKKERPISYVSFWKASNNGGSGSKRWWKLSQTISDLPAGTYKVSYQCMTYNLDAGGNHKFTINGVPVPWTNVGTTDPGSETVAANLAAGYYTHEVTVTVTDDDPAYANKIIISVDKTGTSSVTGAYYDNFKIKCIGIDGKIDMSIYDRVKIAIDDAQEKANELGIAYNNRGVVSLWKAYEIVGDGWNEINQTYKNLAEAVIQRKVVPSDYTYAMVNPSFELFPDYKDSRYNIGGGFPLGWSYPTKFAYDSGVWPATDEWKHTDNPHGEYIFNTWENEMGGNAVYQEISLNPGIYRLTAKVASGEGNTVYLFTGTNGETRTSVTTVGKSTLVPVTLHFTVPDGKPVRIGVAGARANGSFTLEGGQWYKADDFHLTYIGDQNTIKGYEKLQLAINDAKAKSIALGKELDLSKYQDMVDNYTIVGDGETEFYEVYSLLRKLVFYQSGKTYDVTAGIINNSFEWGNLYGWDTEILGDTKAAPNSDNTYKVSNADGNYVFNTWKFIRDGHPGAGAPLTQTITDLKAGKYELTVLLASEQGHKYYLAAFNDFGYQYSEPVTTTGKGTMVTAKLTFNVATDGNSVTIGVYPTGDNEVFNAEGTDYWYKADNFRLTYMGDPSMDFFYDYLKQAIDHTTALANTLPEEYKSQWSKKIEDIYAIAYDPNVLLEGNGVAEAKELYRRLRELAYSQDEPGADMSVAIINNSFEVGDHTGWTFEHTNDTSVKTNEGVYYVDNCDSNYLFNTWDGDDRGEEISQVIPGLPMGIYRIEAGLTSHEGRKVQLFANEETTTITATGAGHLTPTSVEIVITEDGTDLLIGARGLSSWYKADNFRLVLVGKFTELEDLHSTVNSFAQLVPGADYIIAAPHATGHHVLGHNDNAVRALTDADNKISHIVEAHTRVFTLKQILGDYVLVPNNVKQSSMKKAVSTNTLYLTFNQDGEDVEVKTAKGGPVVKFDPASKTFGTEENHTEAAKLYTAAFDETLTGVENVMADENDGKAVFYDLQGIRVDNPGNGIYIMKKGDRVMKVLIKR